MAAYMLSNFVDEMTTLIARKEDLLWNLFVMWNA